jgi:hypothetical protein
MPAVALGRAEWTADEAKHLGSCRSCGDEWEIVRVTSLMGVTGSAALDPARTTRAVLQRLSEAGDERRKRRAWTFAGLAAAAALAVAVWTGQANRPAGPPPQTAAGLQIPLPELDNLEVAELNSVLETMDESVGGSSTPDTPDAGYSEDDELDFILDSWEG